MKVELSQRRRRTQDSLLREASKSTKCSSSDETAQNECRKPNFVEPERTFPPDPRQTAGFQPQFVFQSLGSCDRLIADAFALKCFLSLSYKVSKRYLFRKQFPRMNLDCTVQGNIICVRFITTFMMYIDNFYDRVPVRLYTPASDSDHVSVPLIKSQPAISSPRSKY